MHHLRCARACLPRLMICSCLLVSVLTGCGKKTYPIQGKITLQGGTLPARELGGYLVVFESEEQRVSANGVVRPDGTFQVGTFREEDGAVPGKHRVALTPPLEEEGKPRPRKLLPERYQRFETSGLEVLVKPQKNEITLEVEGLKR